MTAKEPKVSLQESFMVLQKRVLSSSFYKEYYLEVQ